MKKLFVLLLLFCFNAISFSQTNNHLAKDKYKVEILSRNMFYINEVPKFLLKVTQDEYELKKLKVILNIATPSENILKIKLNDNGAFGDLKAKDGIFSSFLTGFSGAGNYSIGIQIEGEDLDGNPLNIVKTSSIQISGYRQFPIKIEPIKIEFRNGVPGVKNSSGFQIKSKSRKKLRILLYFTHLKFTENYKIPNWQIKADPFALTLYPDSTKRIDIYVIPDKYAREGNYKGYVILDMINTAMRIPIKFEILKNVNLTFWRRTVKASSPFYIILYIIVVGILFFLSIKIWQKVNSQKLIAEKLIIDDGDTKTEIRLEKEEYTIGRDRDNDIELFDESVSRKHAKIVKENLVYKIKDNNSTNGIYINGKKVTEKILKKSDSILIGKFKIIVK